MVSFYEMHGNWEEHGNGRGHGGGSGRWVWSCLLKRGAMESAWIHEGEEMPSNNKL